MNLVGFRTFREKIAGLFIPQDFFKQYVSNYLPQIDREGFRLKTLYDFLATPLFLCCALLTVPTSASHLLSDYSKCSTSSLVFTSLYVFLSCVALRGSCAKTSLDWSC